eukprot:m.166711 g.166711  ORF g.166711 m.166711 type:complete len:499 (-) comp10338_c0_seq5:67-1563(-)
MVRAVEIAVAVLALHLLCAAASSSSPTLQWIRSSNADESNHFYDDLGRVRFFHGVSDVQKGIPWYDPVFYRNDSALDFLQDLGINFVRLGMMWSGAEPSENQFNASYYAVLDEIVERLAQRGMYTMFDVHQDGMSSYFCLYDGFPRWVVDKRSTPRHAFPWPLNASLPCQDRFWEKNFFSEAMGQAYQDFYNNHNGMQDAFANFWRHSAKHFAGNPNVIGYELINEPWAGDVFKEPTLFEPGKAGSQNLMPLYNNLVKGIRAEDPDHLVFFEPVTWGMVFDGKVVGTGFTEVPGGPAWSNKSVLSYHWYCPFYHEGDVPSVFTKVMCDKIATPEVMRAVTEDVKGFGGASMMTEWVNCDPNSDAGRNECNTIMDNADKLLQSWAIWDILHLWQNGPQTLRHQQTFSRTYAMAVAGLPQTHMFDPSTSKFVLTYELRSAQPNIEAMTTIIYANMKIHYPHGAKVTTSPGVQYTITGNLIKIVPTSSVANGALISVQVAP